jgi:membrane-associated phospholipid phosphatase
VHSAIRAIVRCDLLGILKLCERDPVVQGSKSTRLNLDYLDYTITTFANGFAGRNALIDGFMWQLCDNYILSTVPLTALLVFLWNKNASDQRRMSLLAGAVAIGLSGLVSKLLQKILPMIGLGRIRPLYDPNLAGIIHWPIGLPPHMLEEHSSWPSDSAAWLFGLALLIWLHGGKRLGIPALCLAALSSLTRIPMGIHFLSDILCGAALGAPIVLASQSFAIPHAAFKILKLQRKWPLAFCVAMFVATYSLATFGADLRELASHFCFSPAQTVDASAVSRIKIRRSLPET